MFPSLSFIKIALKLLELSFLSYSVGFNCYNLTLTGFISRQMCATIHITNYWLSPSLLYTNMFSFVIRIQIFPYTLNH